VVIGGLLSATILTLIVLPLLYLMFEQRHERHASRIAMPAPSRPQPSP
jgi:Cu/Ag efflux pump CusA